MSDFIKPETIAGGLGISLERGDVTIEIICKAMKMLGLNVLTDAQMAELEGAAHVAGMAGAYPIN
jgi:hypothetical protein